MMRRCRSSSMTGNSSPCADRMSAIHTALPPEPVLTATRSPRVGAPDLGEDQRLAEPRGFLRDGAEPPGIADPFEIAHEDVGAAGVEHPVEIVVRFEHGLVTGADLVGELELPVAAAR